jgi:hypothetical protein
MAPQQKAKSNTMAWDNPCAGALSVEVSGGVMSVSSVSCNGGSISDRRLAETLKQTLNPENGAAAQSRIARYATTDSCINN